MYTYYITTPLALGEPGKMSSKWQEKIKKVGLKTGVAEIMAGCGPVVVIKRKGKAKGFAKQRGRPKGHVAKPSCVSHIKVEEKIENHEDIKKNIVVASDEAGEDKLFRRGVVTSVTKVTEKNGFVWFKYGVMEDGTKANQFFVNAQFCQDPSFFGTVHPSSFALDWRKLRGPSLSSMIKALNVHTNPDNLELVQAGELTEHSTILAGILEIQQRFQSQGLEFKILGPQECINLGDPGGIPEDLGGESEKCKKAILAIRACYFGIWSQGPPRHYTYLKLSRDESGHLADYKDSLSPAAPANLMVAKTILINLGLSSLIDGLLPSNKGFQKGGWECGIYFLKWLEHDLRMTRKEAPMIYVCTYI
jgi:hypothetical protein